MEVISICKQFYKGGCTAANTEMMRRTYHTPQLDNDKRLSARSSRTD
ncbi:MAG: hypothetical protein IIU85_00660 [Rikenellaceae bacterium]|nr:hypothetical protein [Rikenellaceae bacterium]